MDWTNQLVLLAGLLFVLSVLATVVTPRFGVPTLLIFLIIGMLAGVNGPGGIDFSDYQLANFACTAALAVILFDGGMRTTFYSFKLALGPALSLASVGVVMTCVLTGVAAAWIFALPLPVGLLLGAIVASTDAAAVFALLHSHSVRLNQRVTSALEIESGTNDPAAVFLTLALIEYVLQPESFGWVDSLLFFIWQMGGGALIGITGGFMLALMLPRLRLPDPLYPILVLFSGLLAFGVAATLDASGFLAAYVAGLVFGNQRLRGLNQIRRFHDGIAWMAQVGTFVILGLLVTPRDLIALVLPTLALALVLIVLARPLAVLLCLLPFRFPWREQVFISWVGLRGSVPIVLATYVWLAGIEQAGLFFNVAFLLVLISLVVQGGTIARVARWLNLQVPRADTSTYRTDFDLPGQQGYEIVTYRLASSSMLVGLTTREAHWPESVRVICIVRNKRLLARGWGPMQGGDYVALLAHQVALPELDRLFSLRVDTGRDGRVRQFGDLTLQASVSLVDLLQSYGLEVPENVMASSVGQYLASVLTRPVVGDRLTLNGLQLIVRAMDQDQITLVGMRFVPPSATDAEADDYRAEDSGSEEPKA